jgi:hypothetical protein
MNRAALQREKLVPRKGTMSGFQGASERRIFRNEPSIISGQYLKNTLLDPFRYVLALRPPSVGASVGARKGGTKKPCSTETIFSPHTSPHAEAENAKRIIRLQNHRERKAPPQEIPAERWGRLAA